MNSEIRPLRRITFPLLSAGLLGHPACILVYWVLYPAYGLINSGAILDALEGQTAITTIANAFALASCLLAIPATLAAVVAIGDRSPKLGVIGGAMSITGWVAVFGILVLDPVAIQMVALGPPAQVIVDLFGRVSTSPTVIALNALAAFHLIGGVVLGIAFWRTRLIPRWAAMILVIGGPIHFGSNIAGMLMVDSLTWIALIAANVHIIRLLRSPG